jgi:tetratricopeptide (TPR) repeat protein
MRYRIVLCMLLAGAIAFSAGAQTKANVTQTTPATGTTAAVPGETQLKLSPFWIQAVPALSIPLGESASFFTLGGGGELTGEYRLPFFPLALLRAEIGYGYFPIPARQSVSFTSAGAGIGMSYNFIPNLGVKVYADGGATYGFFNSTFEGYWNPYVKGGLDVYASFPPGFMISLGGTFLYQIGLYMGVGATLGVSVGLGTPVAVQSFKPAAAKPLQEKPQPLQNATKTGAGLELSQLNIQDIYPVFYKFYDDHPIGNAVLHNWEKTAVQNVKVSVWIKEYMNDAKEVPGPAKIDSGQDATVDLFALLKKDVLTNTEDTKVSANLTVKYTLNGKEITKDSVQTIRILKRNSLTWDDDRKAAAFVTPNDPTAVKFAKNVASMVNGKGNTSVEPNIRLASAIHNALTLYGLTYSTDPVATLNSDNKTVDYIQFPQQTLDYRSGKCSDFSALYASMFEALGLETAFITIPGHIYMAVALSLSPADARASFTHKDDLIIKDNKVWLPIEITLREGGFLKAWQLGAKEWRENLVKNQAVLYPVREAWKIYEPVGFATGASDVKLPTDVTLVKAFTADLDAFVKGEMGQQELALQTAVTKATTQANKSKSLNSLAVLHSRFGLIAQAQKEFEQVLAKEEYLPSLINLGNIYFMQDENEKALEFYNRAAKKAPKNATVLLCIARANHAMENYSSAKKAYADLQTVNPDLAQQFAYLDLRGEEATRAADITGVRGTVVWSE